MKNKILWKKPNYKNQFCRVLDKEIDEFCLNRVTGTGDIQIERSQYGRKIEFIVYRVEKIGELVEGIETLSRQQLIEELKIIEKEKKEKKEKRNVPR